ncbi:MAG: hypothetical protein ABI910_04690 [Gemmatimonadota bacterium]
MPYDFEADAQLMRAMLGTAAHDLGGVSSALALRADVLASALPPEDVAALRGVVDHVRALGRQLRRLRGPAGGSNFAPASERALPEWIALIERFGGPVLGRGIELRTSCNAGTIRPGTEHALTFGVLALFHAVREARDEQTVTVEVDARSSDAGIEVTVRQQWASPPPILPLDDRWSAHARDVVTRAGLSWEQGDQGDQGDKGDKRKCATVRIHGRD